jgi:mono/diheme cytochrome c family protein
MPKPQDPLSDTLYDMTSLNRLFFASSILLIAATIWMTWQDYDRNWKGYQKRFNELALERTQKEKEAAEAEIENRFPGQLQALQKKLEEAQARVEAKEGELDKLREERESNRGPLEKATLAFQFSKSVADTAKYVAESTGVHAAELHEKAEAAKKAGDGKADSLAAEAEAYARKTETARQKFMEIDQETNDLKLEMERFGRIDRELEGKIAAMLEEKVAAEKEIAKLTADVQTKIRAISKLEPSLSKALLSAPGLDMLAPPLKINQIITDMKVSVNFSVAQRIDRCTTCHLAIDRKGWTGEELKNTPFKSHPNLDLYVGDSSPHPMSKFGCTVCHAGQGMSVDFYYAAHMPRDKAQAKEWEELYHWTPIHHFDDPMLPTPYIEASCTKCHSSQTRVTMAPKLNEGKRLLERLGCFGCHPVKGTEDLRKPGPGLYGIRHKVTKDWAYHWIRNPKDFRPTTHMPRFFDLSNTSDGESKKKNAALIAGMVEYLWENEDLESVGDKGYPPPPAGDAKRGKALVESVGCTGCHVVDAYGEKGNIYRNFGPNLAGIGSKVNPGWTFAWLKNPTAYFHYASMPSLRLSDAEAADITAFLMTLKHPEKFEDRKMPELPDADLDDTLFGFMKAQMTEVEARNAIKEMTRAAKLQELGKRGIGQFGCFGCHDIKGFEKTKKIGAELTGANSIGSKDITKFDFGFRHDLNWEHTPGAYDRVNWVRAKLEDPRTFDNGRIISFEDKSRMPLFDLTPEEIDALATYVLSFRLDLIPANMLRNLSHEEIVIDRGKRLAMDSNCAACHKIGVWPTRIAIDESDERAGEVQAMVVYTARNILSDGREVDRISPDEMAILDKKGIAILAKKGTWLTPAVTMGLAGRGIRSVLVYGEGEAGIGKLVHPDFVPPVIVGEGAKTYPDWLFRFLKSPTPIRPWFEEGGVRMPTFGFTDDEATLLVEHFARIDGKRYPYQSEPAIEERARQELIARGEKLFLKNECGKCHVVEGVKRTTDTPAPPFAKVGPRIQREWFRGWLRDPQSFMPGTKMTAYGQDAVAENDVDALREYIWSLHGK